MTMTTEKTQRRQSVTEPVEKDDSVNPYLELGFLRFALLTTIVTAFFPWSLLANLLFKGLADTKFLIAALLRDYLQTLLALAFGIVILLVGLVTTFFYFWPSIVTFVADLWAWLMGLF
jgi:hypothetical protein